ncbi:MAG: hypothetical protein GY820_14500 [Gammaproteobacteria bacterium]|nr:hypothetical protein [Gammaproteobacteria bacterium]
MSTSVTRLFTAVFSPPDFSQTTFLRTTFHRPTFHRTTFHRPHFRRRRFTDCLFTTRLFTDQLPNLPSTSWVKVQCTQVSLVLMYFHVYFVLHSLVVSFR